MGRWRTSYTYYWSCQASIEFSLSRAPSRFDTSFLAWLKTGGIRILYHANSLLYLRQGWQKNNLLVSSLCRMEITWDHIAWPRTIVLYFALPSNTPASLLCCEQNNAVCTWRLPCTESTFRLYFSEFTSEFFDLAFLKAATCFSYSSTIQTVECWYKSQSDNFQSFVISRCTGITL